jgi:hypothetical protein
MKANYNPEGRGHSSEDINARAEQVLGLTEFIQPLATDAFRGAILRQTAGESAAALSDEAALLLKDILAEMENQDEVDVQSVRLATQLSEALASGVEEPDSSWIAARGADLARNLVVFWFNLDADEHRRPATCEHFLAGKGEARKQQEFDTLCSRFYLRPMDAMPVLADVASRNGVPLPTTGGVRSMQFAEADASEQLAPAHSR